MKFVSNNGKEYNNYIKFIFANTNDGINKFIDSKFKGYKESKNLSFNNNFNNEIEEYYNIDDDEDDMEIPSKKSINDEDNLYISESPINHIKHDKKHSIKIDYKNNKLILEDEDGNTIHSTEINDYRLNNFTVKDIINMVYDNIYNK